jgi:hypothetical protein
MATDEAGGTVTGVDSGVTPQTFRRFGIFDRAQRLSGTISLTVGTDDAAGRTTFSFWREDRTLVHAAPPRSDVRREESGAITAGTLAMSPAGPDDEWDLTFENADARARLRFAPTEPPYTWSLRSVPGFGHREQAGSIEGTLEVRGERFEINSVGYHELETGPDLTATAEHVFTTRVYVDPETWAYATVVTVARRDYLFGYLQRGERGELQGAEIAVAHAYAGGPPLVGTVDLSDFAGRRLECSFLRGATYTAVDALPAGIISRHTALPAFAGADGADGAGVGQVDYWYTDPGLARPHLLVYNLPAEPA